MSATAVTLVVAGTHAEYEIWASAQGFALGPDYAEKEGQLARYVHRRQDLVGWDANLKRIVLAGTWRERDQALLQTVFQMARDLGVPNEEAEPDAEPLVLRRKVGECPG